MKNFKKTILGASVALIVCVTLFVGATFAWFTDSVRNSGNTINTGKLDIKLSQLQDNEYVDLETKTAPIFKAEDLLAPGIARYAIFKVENTGSLELKYELNIDNLVNNGLAEKVSVYKAVETAEINASNAENYEVAYTNDFKENSEYTKLDTTLDKTTVVADGVLSKGIAHYVALAFSIPNELDNDYENKGVTFDILLRATQNHDDAVFEQINVDYDKEQTPAQNGSALTTAINEAKPGATIYVAEGEYVIDKSFNVTNSDVIIKGQGEGKTIITFDNEEVSTYRSASTKKVTGHMLNLGNVDVTIDSVEFRGPKNPGNNDISGILVGSTNAEQAKAGTNKVSITNCKFTGFTKNSITIKGGSDVNISSNEIICKEFSGATGNGIQIDYSANAVVNNNTIVGYLSNNEKWQATGILVLRDGKINEIRDNNISNCDTAIYMSTTYDSADDKTFLAEEAESENTFSNNNYDVYRMMKVYTFADMKYAVNHTGKIILMNDIEFTEMVEINKNSKLTLDLNGKNITVPKADRSLYAITNYGELTIDDSSEAKNGTISARGVQNEADAKMYMENGRINSIDSNGGGAAVWNEGYFEMTGGTLAFTGQKSGDNVGSPFTNLANGEAIIIGGNILSDYTCIFAQGDSNTTIKNISLSSKTDYFMTIKILGNANALIENVTVNTQNGGCIENAGGSVTLKDCTFTQTVEGSPAWNSVAVAVSNGAKTTIESGTYTGTVASAYIYTSGGTLTIKGGTFAGKDANSTVLKADQSDKFFDSNIIVNGGEFTGTYSVAAQRASLAIFAGTFSSDPTKYVDAGSKVEQDEDKYIVTIA